MPQKMPQRRGAPNRNLNFKLVALVTEDTRRRLFKLAQRRNVSVGHLVRIALANYVLEDAA